MSNSPLTAAGRSRLQQALSCFFSFPSPFISQTLNSSRYYLILSIRIIGYVVHFSRYQPCPGLLTTIACYNRLFFYFAVLGHTLFKICLVLISFYSIYKVMSFVVTFVYVYTVIRGFHLFFSSPCPLLSLLCVTHVLLFHPAIPSAL